MNSLEQAALSGALTSVNLGGSPDPDGRERIRNDDESTSRLLINYEDNDYDWIKSEIDENDFDRDDGAIQRGIRSSSSANRSPNGNSSQLMTRGWSGNTGPKGVLLDFKASHGKSGAILGGRDERPSNVVSGGNGGGGGTNAGGHHHRKSHNHYSQSLSVARRPGTTGSVFSSTNNSNRVNKRSTNSTPTSADSDSDSDNHRRNTGRFTNRLITSPTSRKRIESPYSPPGSGPMGPGYNGKPFRFDSKNRKLFGHLREVGVDNFIQAVEAEKEDRGVTVLVHLYDPALESCVMVNSHLSNLARSYPRTKFLRALASELEFYSGESTDQREAFTLPSISPSPRNSIDPFEEGDYPDGLGGGEQRNRKATDSDVLPTLIWYRAGEYVQSLPALERELPNGFVDREKSFRELKNLLHRHGIINDLDA